MIRRIIRIDQERCSGCGACAAACHEGAIQMIDGKARLIREDYCDGLGDCLPTCPVDAISFVVRDAIAYDRAAVKITRQEEDDIGDGCTRARPSAVYRQDDADALRSAPSRLSQWPVQIKLAPINAPYFDGARLLVAADCVAYAYGNFHEEFIRDRITLIGCPKLDEGDYAEKLARIIDSNDISDVIVARMEVPCCGGMESAVKRALMASGKSISIRVEIISTDGRRL